jgi:hypothetical protein
MNSSIMKLCPPWAVEQTKQSLEFAANVPSEGKPGSSKSRSGCILSSNAISLSSYILRYSAAGSRRQLSIRKNERKGNSYLPYAPLLLEKEPAAREGKRDHRKEKARSGRLFYPLQYKSSFK